MHVFTDGVLSAGLSEEEHSAWNKVLALRCHYAGPWLRDHLADIEFGEVGTIVSLLSLSTFFVKKALEQGQHGLSHVHKLDLVLFFFKGAKRGGRIKGLTLPLASEVGSFKEDFQEATFEKAAAVYGGYGVDGL